MQLLDIIGLEGETTRQFSRVKFKTKFFILDFKSALELVRNFYFSRENVILRAAHSRENQKFRTNSKTDLKSKIKNFVMSFGGVNGHVVSPSSPMMPMIAVINMIHVLEVIFDCIHWYFIGQTYVSMFFFLFWVKKVSTDNGQSQKFEN